MLIDLIPKIAWLIFDTYLIVFMNLVNIKLVSFNMLLCWFLWFIVVMSMAIYQQCLSNIFQYIDLEPDIEGYLDSIEIHETVKDYCPICLSELNDHNVKLSCGHVYHRKCITQMLHYRHKCALCRIRIEIE